MKTRKAFSIISTVVAVVAIASVLVVGVASAAPATSSITVKSQDCCNSGVVVVDSAIAPQNGWLGIFRDSNGSIGSLVGYVPVSAGQNGRLTIDVNGNRIGSAPTLWAGFLVDSTGLGIFAPGNLMLAPNSPLVAFGTQTAAPAAPATALAAAPSAPTTGGASAAKGPLTDQISIKSQDCCNTGELVANSVTAAQDGWLGIFRDSSGAIGSRVGYVPVVKGQNGQLTIDVNGNRIGSAPTLWAGLLVDWSGTGVFDANTVALAPNTPLVAFATQAAGK